MEAFAEEDEQMKNCGLGKVVTSKMEVKSTISQYCVAKMEANSAVEEDRISALPDAVIQHVLSFLPSTTEAVRTSILSKAWRRQWTHLPLLIFKPCLRPGSYLLPKFLLERESLVRLEMYNCYIKSNWTVNLPSLKSLKMDARGFMANDCNQGIENFVSGCPLLELLELRGFIEDDAAIFSNSLKVLSFVDTEIQIVIDITCPNLVELKFKSSIFPDQMIENVLTSSPCINSLKLVYCWGCDCPELVIASNSLKVLHLENVNDTMISISCPNLVKLDMLFYTKSLHNVVNLPSTVCATLDYDLHYDNEYFENKLLELVQHVSTLTIRRSLVEVMSDLDDEYRPPLPLLKSKCLTLNIGGSFGLALPGIAHALRSPMLETLVIELDSKFREEAYLSNYQDEMSYRLDYWNSIKSTSFACLVSHLKTVEIIGLYERDDNCEIVLEFIEYLLKNARVLETMIVSLEKSRKSFVIKVSQRISSFRRYSQCANVELLCST